MQRIPFSLTLLAAALAAGVPAQAAVSAEAATTKSEEKAEAPIQKVEVKGAADSYNPRRDDTATKIVVNHDEIVKFGDTNVLDVLKRVPGVTVTPGAGRGGDVRMRGLGSGYTQILVDGEKAPAGFTLESLPPDSIERIEVMRAATAEFSTQSIAGTINIVLRKAMRNAQRELKTRVGWSKNAKPAPGMNLLMSDKTGKLAWSLGFNVDTYAFANDFGQVTEARDDEGRLTGLQMSKGFGDVDFRVFSLMPRLTWTFANGDTLTSQSSYNFSGNRSQYDERTDTLTGAAPAYPYLATESDSHSRSARTELNWVKKFGPSTKLDMKVSGQLSVGHPAGERLGYASQYGQPLMLRVDRSESKDRGFATSGKFSTPGAEGHSLMAGWEVARNLRTSIRNIDERRAPFTVPNVAFDDFDAETRRFAAFAQDEWKISNQWSVYGGVRWEGSSIRVEGTGYPESSSHTGVWSPLFQTLYKVPDSKGDQLRLALTRTYKAPFSGSLIPTRYLSLNNTRDSPDLAGNPRLQPEIAIGIDASYEHYWAEGAMVSVSVNTREIDDYNRFLTELGPDGRWVTMMSNNGKAHTRGLELEAKFPLKAVMANAPAIDVRANLSRNWSSVDSVPGPDNRLGSQTPLALSFGGDYKSGRLTTGAGYSYRKGGAVRVSVTEIQVGQSNRSADVYALWKFDPKTQLRFAIGNLLSKDFQNRAYFFDSKGSVYYTTKRPQYANFRLALEFKY